MPFFGVRVAQPFLAKLPTVARLGVTLTMIVAESGTSSDVRDRSDENEDTECGSES